MERDDQNAADTGWAAVTEVFAGHVRRTPDALAVEADGTRLTYDGLAARIDRFAARLAERLPDQRVTGDLLIGVCLVRDVDLPAWLLAIMTVGGAYLPIDPTTPPARLANVMEDAKPALVVASGRYAALFADAGVAVMVADDDPGMPLAPAPRVSVRPDMLAYVIFTSGSTGRPKGVEIEHGSLVGLMATMADRPGLAAGERMLGLTRASFDLSVPDLFLPLFVGGSLALVDLDTAADPRLLADAFAAYRPNLVQATPSTWRALVESGWQGQADLRIVAGGEALTRALADALLPRCDKLWNIYGPTETTVWSTAARIGAGDEAIPIGWPMTGYRVHVADADGAPLPAGEVGEIVIGGIGVARGYRNRPDLTAERFVTDAHGARAYRTGDLGRLDERGALYCLGRVDDQVKVRGFRIELGDVEAALALHPAITWSAVRLWTDPSGEPVMVAYIVSRPGLAPAPTAREVRTFMATRLAPYMIPDRVVALTVMPLSANGKVDRAALPDPFDVARPVADDDADTEIGSRLAIIWNELLGTAAVSVDDDFFDLGGYSLMTVRLARRIEAEFGVRLALVEMLRHATLGAMAARIARGSLAVDPEAMLLNAGGDRPPLYWLDAGPLMRAMARGLSRDQPAYALNLDPDEEDMFGPGDLSIADVARVLKDKLVARQPRGPYYLGGWCRWGTVAFELARRLIEEGRDVALLVLLDTERPGGGTEPMPLRGRVSRWLRPSSRRAREEPESFSQRVDVATRRYRPSQYRGDVILFRPIGAIGDAGWNAIVEGTLTVAFTPGNHETMVRGAEVKALATTLDDALLAAQRRRAADAAFPDQAAMARS